MCVRCRQSRAPLLWWGTGKAPKSQNPSTQTAALPLRCCWQATQHCLRQGEEGEAATLVKWRREGVLKGSVWNGGAMRGMGNEQQPCFD
jgi:hypothetical protein